MGLFCRRLPQSSRCRLKAGSGENGNQGALDGFLGGGEGLLTIVVGEDQGIIF